MRDQLDAVQRDMREAVGQRNTDLVKKHHELEGLALELDSARARQEEIEAELERGRRALDEAHGRMMHLAALAHQSMSGQP